MAVFKSDEQFYSVIQGVFDRLESESVNAEKLSKSNMVIRMHFTDPQAQVTIVGSNGETQLLFGPTEGKANMEFTMTADLLHRIWMGDESTSQAFFNGKIKTKGNFMKAMKLIELFRECERVYPSVAAEHELDSLDYS